MRYRIHREKPRFAGVTTLPSFPLELAGSGPTGRTEWPWPARWLVDVAKHENYFCQSRRCLTLSLMVTFDKEWALNQLRHKHNSYQMALAGLHLLNSDATLSLHDKEAVVSEHNVHFNRSRAQFRGDSRSIRLNDLRRLYMYRNVNKTWGVAINEFHFFMQRNIIKEGFEVALTYAKFAELQNILEAEPWYHFVRLIRNAASHNFHYEFSKFDFKILPVTWEGKTVTAAMNRCPISEKFFSALMTIRMLECIEEFISTH